MEEERKKKHDISRCDAFSKMCKTCGICDYWTYEYSTCLGIACLMSPTSTELLANKCMFYKEVKG